MFLNDLTGLSRGNTLGGDIAGQLPLGVNAWGQIPYGYGLGAYNIGPQIFPSAYGVIFHRIPQPYIPQTIAPQGIGPLGQFPTSQPFAPALANIPQTVAPQGIGAWGQFPTSQPFVPVLANIPQTVAPQGMGAWGQFPTSQPFVPVLAMNAPVPNPMLGQGALMANPFGIGYGYTPPFVAPWNSPLGVQPTIFR